MTGGLFILILKTLNSFIYNVYTRAISTLHCFFENIQRAQHGNDSRKEGLLRIDPDADVVVARQQDSKYLKTRGGTQLASMQASQDPRSLE